MDTKTVDSVGPLRGHVFKVELPDGSTEKVMLHVRQDGVIQRIMNGHVLLQLIEDSKQKNRKLNQAVVGQNTLPGMVRTVDAEGNVTVSPRISDKTKRDIQLFSENIPCWFNGCEELRTAYNKEVEEASSSPNCPTKTCFKGPIMQKYLKIMLNMNTEG